MKISIRMPALLLILVLGIGVEPSNADHKLDEAAWKYLTTLVPDQPIRVELKDGKTLKGRIQLLTEDGIVVRIAKKDQKLMRESIQRILVKGESHRGRNASIGALIGGIAGLALGAAMPSGGWQEVYRAREPPPQPPEPQSDSPKK